MPSRSLPFQTDCRTCRVRTHSIARSPVLALLLLIVTLTLAGCGGGPPPVAEKKAAELPVLQAEVLTVQHQSWPLIVRTQGSLVADEVSVVGVRAAGRVAETPVDLGDQVAAGATLIRLDDAEFELAVVQADAQLVQSRAAVGLKPGDPVEKLDPENAPPVRQERALWNEAIAELERARELLARKALTTAELQQVEAAERVAEARYSAALNSVREKIALIGVRSAELAIARQRLDDALIKAPFAGLIEQRHVAAGSYVKVGDPIVTLVRSSPLRFRGSMPERHARNLQVGQEVRLRIESIEQSRTVRVTRISPALDVRSRGLLFEALVDNADGQLRTGLFAEAEVVLQTDAQALVVPASSVSEFAGAEKVWQVIDGSAREQIVQTGQRRGDLVEITDGLSVGDRILLDASQGQVARIEPLPPRASVIPSSTSHEASTVGSE